MQAALNKPPSARQEEVWKRVSQYEAAFGSSPTASYVDHLDRFAAPAQESLFDEPGEADGLIGEIRRLRPMPGQRGIIAAVGGQPVLAEVFASRSALAAHMHPILIGLLMDAAAARIAPEPTPSRRARRFAYRLDSVHPELRSEVNAGAGEALRGQTMYALVHGVRLVGRWGHLTALNPRHPLLGLK